MEAMRKKYVSRSSKPSKDISVADEPQPSSTSPRELIPSDPSSPPSASSDPIPLPTLAPDSRSPPSESDSRSPPSESDSLLCDRHEPPLESKKEGPLKIEISKGGINPAFSFLSSDDGAMDRPGWMDVDEFLLDTLDDPTRNLTIVDNVERGPFGSGIIDALYIIDRGVYWEAITKGFSEVNLAKETRNPRVNGYGFELVIRTRKGEGEEKCPGWVIQTCADLLRFQASDGNLKLGDIIQVSPDLIGNDFSHLTFTRDAKWGSKLKTSFGTLSFYQVVPLKEGEAEIGEKIGTDRFIKSIFFGRVPVTDLARPSFRDHVLWAHFMDEISLMPVPVKGMKVVCQGTDLTISIPNTPSLVFNLLLNLFHDSPMTWEDGKGDVKTKCVWLRMHEIGSHGDSKDSNEHEVFVSSEGMMTLYSLFESSPSSFRLGLGSFPLSIVIEKEPKLTLIIEDIVTL